MPDRLESAEEWADRVHDMTYDGVAWERIVAEYRSRDAAIRSQARRELLLELAEELENTSNLESLAADYRQRAAKETTNAD